MNKIFNNELSAQAYHKVKSMIVSKDLEPGQKIVQDKLAEELGISRTPLRSALQMLEGEGLIVALPRKGVAVREFTTKEIIEIYDCRMALEGMAVRLFTELATKDDVEKLRALFTPFEGGCIDHDAYQKADALFHDTILEGSNNSFLHRLFHLGNLMVCIDMLGLLRPPEETITEHEEIIQAIEKRDADLAESRMQDHLIKTKVLIIKQADA